MNKIIAPLVEFLDSKSIGYELDQETQVVRLGIDADNVRWRCFACMDDTGRFVFVSMIPLNAPVARRVACAELLARINVRLGLGHFEIDFNDGELGYRTVVPVAKRGRLSGDLIEHVLLGHHTIVDRFIPTISAVLFSGLSPEKALALPGKSPESVTPREQFSLN